MSWFQVGGINQGTFSSAGAWGRSSECVITLEEWYYKICLEGRDRPSLFHECVANIVFAELASYGDENRATWN